jgi:AraC family transcriptional regulator of adaptative response / DNA-3-methyladenine glycosylase II
MAHLPLSPLAPPGDPQYQALLARDARFDGQWFVGVSSTGIYCRPICRVRPPRRENCQFFDTAAQAEAAAYRPCLKCRPELAPGPGAAWTVMDASRTLARQAAALLDAGVGGEGSVAGLAQRLGISDRHLRRIFQAEHGVTPLQYVQTRRLLLAKQLLTDTALPITEVALASGWRSLRRFNAAFAERYRLSPSRLRAGRDLAHAPLAASEGVSVLLAYRPPMDQARLLAFFAQRAIPGVELVGQTGVRRSLRPGALAAATGPDEPGSAAGWVQAELEPQATRLRLRFSASLLPHSGLLLAAVRRWFDLDAQPAVIDQVLQALPGEPGLRLPGSLDAFELAVRAVLGQQVTVAAARTLAHRLIDRFGEPVATPWPEVCRHFPQPAVLAAVPLAQIAELGIIRSRVGAIQALARDWPGIQAGLSAATGPEVLITRLCALPGIGPWTAHYIAMRALSWPDAFPPGDVAVLKALREWQGQAPELAPTSKATALKAAIRAAEISAEAWRPWRSYAVLRLWNHVAPSPSLAAPASIKVTP